MCSQNPVKRSLMTDSTEEAALQRRLTITGSGGGVSSLFRLAGSRYPEEKSIQNQEPSESLYLTLF